MVAQNKIINTAAKKVLSPQGLFRKGASRIWLDDNRYFMIQVEFQPSGYSSGTFLNVGISFLWEFSNGLNDTLSFNYGYRENVDGKDFVSYNGDDDKFMAEVEKLAEAAMQRVMEYRLFQDVDYAKKMLLQKTSSRRFWEIYNYSMLCFMKGDFEEGKTYFMQFMDILKHSFYSGNVYIAWCEEFYNHCIKEICPQLSDKESARCMVLEMIRRRRNFFSEKPSYKKMKKENFL